MSEVLVHPDAWDGPVAATDGPQLIVGGPGAGKTEFLVRRARRLLQEGVPADSILMLAFSRRGAAALRRRVAEGIDGALVGAATFHSLALRIVETYGSSGDWPSTPTLLTGPEHTAVVGALLSDEEPSDWPLPFQPLLGTRAFAAEVADFGLRASERLLGPAEIAAFGRADWRGLPGFLRRYRETLVATGRIDYGTLQVEALRLLEAKEVAAALGARFRYLLVDEYQDTTVAQAAIAERMAASHRNLTAAGDPYQSIYSFRGSELSNVADFPDRFLAADGTPARRLVLSTSFRVPRRILDLAVRLTTGAGLPGASGPVRPAPGAGSVEAYVFDQQSAEAEWIASELQRAHLRDHTPYRAMAVMLRTKRRLLTELSRALERRGIPHTHPDGRLTDNAAVRAVLDLAETAADPRGSASFRRVLMGPLIGMPLGAARELERNAVKRGWKPTLAAAGEDAARVGDLLADKSWASEYPAVEGFWHVWTSLPRLVAMAIADDSHRAALASFSQALDRLHERDPHRTLTGYAAIAREEGFEAEPLLSFRDEEAQGVALTTLHQAKGAEFDLVVIADAVEGVLPDLRLRDSLLGTRHLTPGHSGDDTAYSRFRLQEERRLAYTAMCRSRRRVVWTCTPGSRETGSGPPSRFFALLFGDEALGPPGEQGTPTTPAEAEARLRRRASSPELPSAERLAALTALSRGPAWGLRPISAFYGTLRKGEDRGLVPDDLTLSPSQADSYDTCPRRYAFEHRLRIKGGGSMYAELGGLIHRVLEIAEREAVEAGKDHSSGTRAATILDDLFDPADFGGEPWARSWLRRGQTILSHLYEYWPGEGPAVAFESAVRFDLDGIDWKGRVDRAERRADGVHIIDYKTGTGMLSVGEAESALQLGFYAMASGDVTGAEFWYPGVAAGRRKSVAVRRFDMGSIELVQESMRRIQAGILAEDWAPQPGDYCERCPVRIMCPEWPEGEEAYTP